MTKKSAKSSRNVRVSRPVKSAHAVAREREETRRQQQARQNRIIAAAGGILLVILVALIVWQLLPATRDEAGPAPERTEGTLIDGERPLAALEPMARLDFYDSYPPLVIEPGRDYEAVIRTERGDIRLRLFADEAPLTVNNFVFLATEGFYDNTTFHRVLEDFMAQAGDPTGTGMGGPGYRFEDETDNGLVFDRPGLLAMANAGAGTNGSQFFITYGPTSWLDGLHTIFGELIEGEEVLSQLRLRNPDTDPAPGDVIHRIDILESE